MDHPFQNTKEKSKPQEGQEVLTLTADPFALIVHNDDVNTFDWVIKALVEICEHSLEQAEQCALFVHHKGKYEVKHGSRAELQPKKEGLTDRGISATIEAYSENKH